MTDTNQFADSLQEAPLRRLVVIAGHVMRQHWSKVVEQQHGISSSGVNVLIALARTEPPTSHRDLAKRCWIRPASLTPVVDALARDGLVQRRRDRDDRRVVWISLTRQGRQRAKQLLDRLHEHFPEHSAEFDAHAQAVIRSYLIHLITAQEDTR